MIRVCALYRFATFPDPAALREPLLAVAEAHGIRGTLLLANEGINGTIAGTQDGIEAVLDHIRTLPGCAELDSLPPDEGAVEARDRVDGRRRHRSHP